MRQLVGVFGERETSYAKSVPQPPKQVSASIYVEQVRKTGLAAAQSCFLHSLLRRLADSPIRRFADSLIR
jgi:hypothetical protein